MTFLTELFAITIGAVTASFSSNAYLASLMVPFLTIILSLTCGVLSPPSQMSTLYRNFFYNVNPVRYTVSTLIANELYGLNIQCSEKELITFQPPAGQTCSGWASNYVNSATGYHSNPNATSDCGYCTYSNGEEFYSSFGIEFSQRGRNIGILIAFIAINAIATIAFTKYIKFSNR